jgi:hypothetical protein
MPAEDLRPEDRCTRIVVRGIEQRFETSRIRCAVVVQQPHPRDQLSELVALLHLNATHALEASAHCVTEALVGRGDYSVESEGGTQDGCGVIGRASVDADRAISGASLAGQGAHHRRQPGAAVMGDDHSSHVMVTTRQQRLGFGFIVEGEPLGDLFTRDFVVDVA